MPNMEDIINTISQKIAIDKQKTTVPRHSRGIRIRWSRIRQKYKWTLRIFLQWKKNGHILPTEKFNLRLSQNTYFIWREKLKKRRSVSPLCCPDHIIVVTRGTKQEHVLELESFSKKPEDGRFRASREKKYICLNWNFCFGHHI